MAIYNDNFGNFYIGNRYGTTLVNWTEVLSCIRQALGSNDRANANIHPVATLVKIDWRPNVAQETLSGVITAPFFNTIIGDTSTIRFSFLFDTASSKSIISFGSGGISHTFSGKPTMFSTQTSICWVAASAKNFSLFLFQNATNYYFFSNGLLSNSNFNFPLNSYCFQTGVAHTGYTTSVNQNQCRGGTLVDNLLIQATGAIANYSHTKKNGTGTQSEVEFYLRRPNPNTTPLGYIPNVFKWRVDGQEPAPQIGDIVSLNMANATTEYAGHGVIYCVVAGRLGNTSELDLTGDYVLMRVAS